VIPFVTPPEYPAPVRAGRFASGLVLNVPELRGAAALIGKCSVALLGLPDDTGVELNHGRIGAASGPTAFRAALARYGASDPAGWVWPSVLDAGDVAPALEYAKDVPAMLHETHRRVTAATKAICAMGLFPIAIGGGHDLTFAFVRGVIEHARSVGTVIDHGISFDAHLDVREAVGSGMPFRALIEQCSVRSHTVHGLDAMANAESHVRWFREHGGLIAADDHTPSEPERESFVSFDLDVLDASVAPGVSAMNPCGWSVQRAAEWVEVLAASKRVHCLDFMELCPPHDEQGRTARVCVRLFLHALRGLAGRAWGGKEHA
jgi:formiminoglutamase